jgi:hypothetical protein
MRCIATMSPDDAMQVPCGECFSYATETPSFHDNSSESRLEQLYGPCLRRASSCLCTMCTVHTSLAYHVRMFSEHLKAYTVVSLWVGDHCRPFHSCHCSMHPIFSSSFSSSSSRDLLKRAKPKVKFVRNFALAYSEARPVPVSWCCRCSCCPENIWDQA